MFSEQVESVFCFILLIMKIFQLLYLHIFFYTFFPSFPHRYVRLFIFSHSSWVICSFFILVFLNFLKFLFVCLFVYSLRFNCECFLWTYFQIDWCFLHCVEFMAEFVKNSLNLCYHVFCSCILFYFILWFPPIEISHLFWLLVHLFPLKHINLLICFNRYRNIYLLINIEISIY